jgi:hypothetical protein
MNAHMLFCGRFSQFVCVMLAVAMATGPDSKPGAPVFNRTVTLRDTWAKESTKG